MKTGQSLWAVALVGLAVAVGCGAAPSSNDELALASGEKTGQVELALGGYFLDNLTTLNTARWELSNWTNGNPFNVGWLPEKVLFSSGIMSFQLDNTPSFGKPIRAVN